MTETTTDNEALLSLLEPFPAEQIEAVRARFAGRFSEDTSGCWVWNGSRTSAGYGQLIIDGRKKYAHRISYELAGREIPEGLVIDHLCRNRACINPAHLEPVTRRTNNLRGAHPLAVVYQTGRCRRGHDLSITSEPNGKGKRTCGKCRRDRVARRKADQHG